MDKETLYRQVFTSFKNLCAIGEQPSSFSKYCSDHGVNPNLMPIIVKGEYQNIRTLPGYRFRRDIHSVGTRYMEIYENFRELCAQGRQPGTFRDYCAGFGVNRDQMHSYLRRNHLKVAGLPGYDGPAGVGVPHCRDIPFDEIIFEESGFLPTGDGNVITVKVDGHVAVSFPADTDVAVIARFVRKMGKGVGDVGA